MKKEKVIIRNPRLEHVLKGYKAEVGNVDDLYILSGLKKLDAKLKTIDCVAFREAERKRKGLTAKMQEIQRDELNLISQIKKRNLDF